MTVEKMLKEISRNTKTLAFVNEIGERDMNPKETMSQLVGMNPTAYMCWGVSNRVNYNNKVLMLQVNGMHHRGKVWIALAWDDTYTVYITTNQLNVVKKFEMIYFDMLNETIDRFIEKRK